MPYIKPEHRPELDKLIEPLVKQLLSLPLEKQDGGVNYAVTKLLKALYDKGNYFTYNRSMGVLAALQQEWYRRFIAPYEDKKIQENGDV